MTMGERIRRRRQELGLSQQDLSEATGLRRAAISELERGKKTGMTIDTAKALARALGVSVDYLIGTWDESEGHLEAADLVEVGA